MVLLKSGQMNATGMMTIISILVLTILCKGTEATLKCYFCTECSKDGGGRLIECPEKFSIPAEDFLSRERAKVACGKIGDSKACVLIGDDTDMKCYDRYDIGSGKSRSRVALEAGSNDKWLEPLEPATCFCDTDRCNSGVKPGSSILLFGVAGAILLVCSAWF